MIPRFVKSGIYIDLGCTRIRPVDNGVFIPTGPFGDKDPEFQKDLKAFLDKWFGRCEVAQSEKQNLNLEERGL